MAADEDRADRIRALKKEHPEFTWQVIADRIGVSLRAAQSWQEKGGMEYENAKKLAKLWGEDVDYIWRGARPETPDLLAGSQLDRIEAKLNEVLERLRPETLAEVFEAGAVRSGAQRKPRAASPKRTPRKAPDN